MNRLKSTSMSIVDDGYERAREAASRSLARLRDSVEAAITNKYATRLKQAGAIKRFWLRLRIRIEIWRQMQREKEKIAPIDGLYMTTDTIANDRAPHDSHGGVKRQSD
jgi:hypothetical protein